MSSFCRVFQKRFLQCFNNKISNFELFFKLCVKSKVRYICEELKLERLAEIMALTPNYFSHLFKKLNGITVCDYINAKRIEKATRILTSGSNKLTMLEIATTCGFNNTARFNKTFKKYRGFTPSQLKSDPKLLWH